MFLDTAKSLRDLFLTLDKYAFLTVNTEVFHKTTYIVCDRNDVNWVEGSRPPDLIVFENNRIAKYEAENPDCLIRPLRLVLDLVIEVVSPNDKVSELDEKIDACLLDSVRLIWVVDPQRRKAVVYAPDIDQPLHLNVNGVLYGDDVLSGFSVKLVDVVGQD